MSRFDHARAASVVARRELLDAVAAGVAGVELRRLAMRVWALADQVLSGLESGRPAWARCRLWRAWGESIALHNDIPAALRGIALARAAGQHYNDEEHDLCEP